MASDDQERSEKATPKRRQEAREKGQVVSSRELSSGLVILVAAIAAKNLGLTLILSLKNTMQDIYNALSMPAMTTVSFSALMMDGMTRLAFVILPATALIASVGVVSNLMQHGILLTTQPLVPDFSRLDPIAGLKRVVSVQGLVNGFKTFLKFLVIGWVAYSSIKGHVPTMLFLGRLAPGQMLLESQGMVVHLVLWCGSVVAAIGVGDYAFQWWDYEKNLRMSKQEIKEESKQTEGKPLVKQRIRTIQRDMARNRMMSDVASADVVVTNPTRLAIALKYDAAEAMAPKVVAKGSGYIAQKIREVARENGVMIVENKPVARALFKSVEIGQVIPSALYRAVAEILSYVYKLRGRSSGKSK